jgi:hypothetical protein
MEKQRTSVPHCPNDAVEITEIKGSARSKSRDSDPLIRPRPLDHPLIRCALKGIGAAVIPERMTPEQRRDEVALLLAQGLVRLRDAGCEQSAREATESAFVLGFAPQKSVYTDSTNNTNRESK